uniref:peptidyl-tRNA hydrolase n=1 Tax=Plectus sambesii TaxID=2011161 RepID=A0A914UQ39_9BILA
MSTPNPRIMYLLLRRDLLTELKWPLGALITQAAHAATAVLWENRTDDDVLKYMEELDTMRKVTLQVDSKEALESLAEKLRAAGVAHKLWVEQPENIPVCIAVKPMEKSNVHPHLKHLKLFA